MRNQFSIIGQLPMAKPSSTASSSSQELATALLDKLSVYSSDTQRRVRSEFSTDELDCLNATVLSASFLVRTIRNTFAAVNTLPSEVLAHIFEILAGYRCRPSPFLPDLDICENPYAWMVVTRVCRYWRETALSFPALWSDIDSRSILCSLALLDRSAASDAYVYLRDVLRNSAVSQRLDSGRFIRSIADHSGRFKELHIQPTFNYGSIILHFFHHPAPKLRALTIMLKLNEGGSHELPLLFDGHIPNLQVLTLANFTQWSPHQFGTKLTHLCLMDQPLRGRMPIVEFLDFLSTCEVLEELILVNAGPSTLGTPPDLRNVKKLISLSRLRILHIGDWPTPQAVAQFLEHLSLPHRTKIFIWDDCLSLQEELFSAPLPVDLRYLRPLHQLTALHFTYPPTTEDNIGLFSVQNGALVFYVYFDSTTADEMLQLIFTRLDLGNVEELTVGIRSNPELPETTWRDIFAMMPRLRTINILHRPSRMIFSALTAENPSDDILCPVLSWLTVTDDYPVSSISIFLFADERARCGIPLRRLQVVNTKNAYSHHLQDEMQNLRSKIVEVDYSKNELVDAKWRPAGWPTATYRWLLDMRNRQAGH